MLARSLIASGKTHRTELFVRTVAVVLVALFAAAALHEFVYVLLENEHHHDHETCPFCALIHTPILVGLCALALAWRISSRANSILPCEAPPTERFVLQAGPRAPPLR